MKAILFYIFYIFSWILTLLPLKILFIFSDILYFKAYYIFEYRKKIVFLNLKNSFPTKSETEIKHIAKAFYKHFCDTIFETLKLIHLSKNEMKRRVKYNNPELISNYYNQNKHVILVLGHYGNWEWITSLAMQIPHKSISIYRPLKNKFFDTFLHKLRIQYGCEIIPMHKTYQTLIGYYQNKILTTTGFISDQRPVIQETQYWTNFLNQETGIFLGIEKIAKKIDAAIVFLKMNKVKRGYYEVDFIPLFENTKNLDPYVITEAHVKMLEKTINEKPEYWLWTHRRWKRKKNELTNNSLHV